MRNLKVEIKPYTLQFKRPAGTSRGVYVDHKIWYVIITDKDTKARGIGECAPLFDLSCDYNNQYEQTLAFFCKKLELEKYLDKESLRKYPSILFGLETAMQQVKMNSSFKLWDTDFSKGEVGIPINGLIWMGNFDYMLEQIEAKLQLGFKCIKLKIGAIDFDHELSLLKHIRNHYSAQQITLRVDANGGFNPEDALEKLNKLAALDIHSIEQPIKAGMWKTMSELVKATPVPIALDEELIGINNLKQKQELLQTIQPQYIILKPTLHGGILGSEEWIQFANNLNIGWWITSALESNIGLNAIAQWCSSLNISMPQGLGTGGLYTNNIEMPLTIKADRLWYNPNGIFFDVNKLCFN